MKRILFFQLLLVLGFSAGAQTETGNFLLGGNLQLNTAKNNTEITFSLSIGYFFVDNFAAGANITMSYSKVGESSDAPKTTVIGIGPFVRYYTGTTTIRPFLQGDVDFSSSKLKA